MKRFFLLLLILNIPLLLFSQTEGSVYKGTAVDARKNPLDVFSIIVVNDRDTTEQAYANTFVDGKFSFTCKTDPGQDYRMYILSMGFEDTYYILDRELDTVVMRNRLVKLDDATIKGKRSITSAIGKEGGVQYDVSNTSLSDIGSSVSLLNYIPGLKVNRKGEVELLGGIGSVVVYINNVKMEDNEKLLSLRSEDIKTVEVLRSPGARYKDAEHVVLITTNRAIDGFGARVEMGYLKSYFNLDGFSPNFDLSYTKNKLSLSASYYFNSYEYMFKDEDLRSIKPEVITGEWRFKEQSNINSKNASHWYNAIMDYRINDRNKLVVEYAGSLFDNRSAASTLQDVSVRTGPLYFNELMSNGNSRYNRNKLHLFYRGDINENFNIEFNADASLNTITDYITNEWNEKDETTGEKEYTSFVQDKKQTSGAYTADIIFNNRFGKKHSITYGAEYTFLQDHINMKSTNTEYGSSSYSMDSHFLKAFAEYRLGLGEKLSLTAGASYMYSNINGTDYKNVAPKLSADYYDNKSGLGINLSFRYDNYAPRAGDLNDKITTVVTPYEIRKGNGALVNYIQTITSLTASYKGITLGIWHQYYVHGFTGSTLVTKKEDGTPLLVNMTTNLEKPVNVVNLYGSYMKDIGFWTPSVYVSVSYTDMHIQQEEGVFEHLSGFKGYAQLYNRFRLPKGFAIQLNGYYSTRGYSFYYMNNQRYSVSGVIEKQFFENKLNINLEWNGIIYVKYATSSYEQYGLHTINRFTTKDERYVKLNVVWRFNNYKQIQRTKDNAYLDML